MRVALAGGELQWREGREQSVIVVTMETVSTPPVQRARPTNASAGKAGGETNVSSVEGR